MTLEVFGNYYRPDPATVRAKDTINKIKDAPRLAGIETAPLDRCALHFTRPIIRVSTAARIHPLNT